ncbi:MAG: hypothetical protein WAS21_31090 [Geminicoccaceae bacterium]
MRLLPILAVLARLFVVWPLLWLWWLALLAKGLILATGDITVFLLRLLIGGVLRPLGHRYALIACALLIIVIAAQDPRAQNPNFYGVLGGALLVCFLSGKFGRLLLPKSAPDISGMFPALPGWPTWPPIPKPRPRVAPARSNQATPPPRHPEPQARPLTMPERPTPSAVQVMAVATAIPSPSEEEAVAALPDALQRLMRPKELPVTGGPAAPEASG